MSFGDQAALSAFLLNHSTAFARVGELRGDLDADFVQMLAFAAADFAQDTLAPLNAEADRLGVTLEDGRVTTPDAYKQAWQAFAENGWLGVDAPPEVGGQGLPLAVQTAGEMLFERAAMAFSMLPGSTRCAVFALAAHADAATRDLWCPKLLDGSWSATICISEADAGSDLGRIRTSASRQGDTWHISGRKSWISYGGHDLTDRIGHMVLARTGAPESGTRGLSLFLVPDTLDDGVPNGITIERIEEKMGLHGSPTCVMRFEASEAILIGERDRGLPQLFAMIERMRLLTGVQGAGIAHASLDLARQYASERRQGGTPDQQPLPIAAHPDVQRQLAELASRTLTLHAFLLEVAAIIDLSDTETDPEAKAHAASVASFLLPLAKNFGGETGFDAASRAVQVFGGAGYTKEWPVEQHMRDARILTIFEGTTGMQALDLLHRRLWKENGRGLAACARRIREEIANARAEQEGAADAVEALLSRFEAIAERMQTRRQAPKEAEYAAEAFLTAAWATVSGWMALRLIRLGSQSAPQAPLCAAAGRLRLAEAAVELEAAAAKIERDPSLYQLPQLD